MQLDAVFLSRLQWAWVIAWHILLPAFTVGLASYIAVLEGLYLFTGRDLWFRISGFWTKIFAVSFGMGVVSGVIMPFQFGTNWSQFTDATADVLSPMMAYEGLMAFFLEFHLPGRAAVWAPVSAAVGTLLRRAHGRIRHLAFVVLDIIDKFVDADAAGLQGGRRPLCAGRLARHRVQSVVSLSPAA